MLDDARAGAAAANVVNVHFEQADADPRLRACVIRRGAQPVRRDVLRRPVGALANIARALRPGGRSVSVHVCGSDDETWNRVASGGAAMICGSAPITLAT